MTPSSATGKTEAGSPTNIPFKPSTKAPPFSHRISPFSFALSTIVPLSSPTLPRSPQSSTRSCTPTSSFPLSLSNCKTEHPFSPYQITLPFSELLASPTPTLKAHEEALLATPSSKPLTTTTSSPATAPVTSAKFEVKRFDFQSAKFSLLEQRPRRHPEVRLESKCPSSCPHMGLTQLCFSLHVTPKLRSRSSTTAV